MDKQRDAVMLVFGTRPEAIKMVALIRALQASATLRPVVCVTAQHRQMLDPILELFAVRPDFDLNVMAPGQSLAGLSGRILSQLEPVLAEVRPRAVLVQGDTTTTLCAALAAFYQRIPVGHVEAGLRTGDLSSPFPEEMNRVLTTRISRWHFAATQHNRQMLLEENIDSSHIFVTGNTVIDALMAVRTRIESGNRSVETEALLARRNRPYVLITGHRRESFGAGFQSICAAIARLASEHPEVDFVYPVHLNPQVQQPVHQWLGDIANVHLLEPLAYESFVALMMHCHFVMTDSGGIQEEAPALGKPVLVLRDKTERVEGLEGRVQLVGTETTGIVEAAQRWLRDTTSSIDKSVQSPVAATSPYGAGDAALKIIGILEEQIPAFTGPRCASPEGRR